MNVVSLLAFLLLAAIPTLTRATTFQDPAAGIDTESSESQHNHLRSGNGGLRSLIIGGSDVNDGRYGFFVQGKGNCSGSLVAPDVVLTAAHCNNPWAIGKTVIVGNYERLVVTLGAEARNITSEQYRHPNYRQFSSSNDLMLVKIEPSTNTPIALNSREILPIGGQKLTVIGFGVTENGTFASTLQEVNLTYVPNSECRELLKDEEQKFLDRSMMCTLEDNKDACFGDSGGALFAKRSGVPILMGLVSWGNGCALPDSPGVYSRISHNIDWIQETICALTDFPDFCLH